MRRSVHSPLFFLLAILVAATAAIGGPLASGGPGDRAAAQQGVTLRTGGNFVAYFGETLPVAEALNTALPQVQSLFAFAEPAQQWKSWTAGLPAQFQQVEELVNGRAYFVVARASATWTWSNPSQRAMPAVDLVQGFNSVAYTGTTLPVAEALNNVAADVATVWRFNATAQGWESFTRDLPDALQQVRNLDNGTAYFLVYGPPAGTWEVPGDYLAPSLTDQAVIDQVVQPATLDHNALVFRHPVLLQTGQQVLPGFTGGAGDGGLTAASASYLYWVDDRPGAQFEHDSRFVLVDAETGAVTVSSEQWWPELDGLDLFTDEAEYWNPARWVFSRLEPNPTPEEYRSGGAPAPSVRAEIDIAQAPQLAGSMPDGECIVMINGSTPGEGAEESFSGDLTNWGAFADAAGYEQVIKINPPNNKPQNFEDALRTLNSNPNCRDITLYMSMHGGSDFLLMGGEAYTAQRLKAFLETSGEIGKNFKVLLQGCKTGSFVDDLQVLSNVEIVVTPTNATTSSYGDWDPDSDPNKGDTGSEFTSGFVEDLNILMGSAIAVAAMQQEAAQNGTPYAQVLYYCAFQSAVAKDSTAMAAPGHVPEVPQIWERMPTTNDIFDYYTGELLATIPYPCPSPRGFMPPAPGG